MRLDARLAAVAAEAGAAGFGICTAEPFLDVRTQLEARKSDGSHAGLTFTYNHPERSTDVRRTFPWAERLVVVAWPYVADAGSPGPAAPGTGRVARFATADHYQGLGAVLSGLNAVLVEHGYRTEVLADDNRLVDRAAAVRAGVGWWGKSTMVLVPGPGPWVLLGSVVTDARLDPTAPMRRDCGTCVACLPACPTGAIIAPGMLDARRCLAHWAQAPGLIPVEFRTAMGDRLYGCDDCLEACPPGVRALKRSSVRSGRVDLTALLAASDDELLAGYAHFYLPGRRPNVLRRNALIALGNVGGPGHLPIVTRYLGDPDWVLRAHAAWALGAIGGEPARHALVSAATIEADARVRTEIEAALR